MKGIVLLSHGSLARGLADAATFFMGDSIEQLEYCCLRQDSSPDEFAEELKRAIEKVDTGEGAVILADLFGGDALQPGGPAAGRPDRSDFRDEFPGSAGASDRPHGRGDRCGGAGGERPLGDFGCEGDFKRTGL